MAAFKAAQSGDLEALQQLASHNPALLCSSTNTGMTPFLTSCASGQLKVAQWLVAHEFATLDESEHTVRATGLHLATARNHYAIVEWMLRSAPQLVDARTRENATPLRIAGELGDLNLVSLLLHVGL